MKIKKNKIFKKINKIKNFKKKLNFYMINYSYTEKEFVIQNYKYNKKINKLINKKV